ncbi:MAG: hypothetical protein K8I30_10100 [Anaerolineae bacterium]|nr:hypothetical protein [Anaerolineae bacterium]
MKISLWQQFSSNNSSHFTIVGVFPSPEAAQDASEKVRAIMGKIDQWHIDHPAESEAIFNQGGQGEISEVEEQLAQTYDIHWDQPMLWAWNYKMLVQDNIVLLLPEWGADSGAHPIDKLLRKLGADVAVDGDVGEMMYEQYGIVRFEVTCIAPDEAAAAFLVNHAIYKAKVLPIPGSTSLQVKLAPRRFDYSAHFDERPELFTLIDMLKKRGLQQIEVKLSSQLVDVFDYDDLGDELENGDE